MLGTVRMLVDNDLGGIREPLSQERGSNFPGVTQWTLGQGYVGSRVPARSWRLPAGEGAGSCSHCLLGGPGWGAASLSLVSVSAGGEDFHLWLAALSGSPLCPPHPVSEP